MGHVRANPAAAAATPRHASGTGGPPLPQTGVPSAKGAAPAWKPLLDNADPGFSSRWLWFLLLATAGVFIARDGWTMFETGQPRALVEIGLGRIVSASQEWPVLRPAVAMVIGIEHFLAAAWLFWLSIVMLRRVPVPRPSGSEMLVCATRQVRHLRLDRAIGGLLLLGAGAILAAHAAEWITMASRHVPALQNLPPGALIVLAGGIEFHGIQKLLRAAVVYFCPAERCFLVVIADPHNHGINNRLIIGDGSFGGARQICLYHEQVFSVRHDVSHFRGRFLGMGDIVLEVQDAPNGPRRTVIVQAPASIAKTQKIVDTLAGIWRVALRRDQIGILGRGA
ncbi:hypothetical protein [Falsiroseomonas stagni]|uniref:Uncharacterized protein n=1 Tax=Falsiroseomonas stagni DSM 19981 TaxID=1123062 RepID=A0A1I4F7H5_9PROT|nr:hypothetical protein [Falsiroseomonas stagni]SFL13854.1 hypothetical protein SAMN02745775_1258 [Falsiroseomonas stagni DSM 19981]